MVEHLYESDFDSFIAEAYRVLVPGGILRIAIPDLKIGVEHYLKNGDADELCEYLLMGHKKKMNLKQKIMFVIYGGREHKWMYDGASLKKYITQKQNFDVFIMPAGKTHIQGNHGIDLYEREGNSVYLECIK